MSRQTAVGPRVIGWGKPLGADALSHHAVISTNERGSVVTLCDGRWSTYEAQCYHPGVDAIDRITTPCGRCERLSYPQRLLLAALRMLFIRDDATAPVHLGSE